MVQPRISPACPVFENRILFFWDSNMKRIQLTQGQFAIVDDDMYEFLMQWKWYAVPLVYGGFVAIRKRSKSDPQGSSRVYMHRVVLDTPPGFDTDHRNHETLDNRLQKLRVTTRSQNLHNQRPKKKCTSQYQGVTFHGGSWESRIKKNRRPIYIGRFTSEIEAAQAYDKKAQEIYGEFACLNF